MDNQRDAIAGIIHQLIFERKELKATKAKPEGVRSEDEVTLLANAEAARTKHNRLQNKRNATNQDELKTVKAKTVRSEDKETLLANDEADVMKRRIVQNKRRAANQDELKATKAKPKGFRSEAR